MKRIISTVLALVMISTLVLAVSCSSAEEEVFDVDFSRDLSKIDLEGIGIIYNVFIPASFSPESVCLGYELDTVFADMASKRLSDVQKDLNCVIEVTYEAGSTANFYAATISGTYVSDAVMGVSDIWTDAARAGMMIGMSELEEFIDYRNEAKWGYRNMLEVIYYEDDLYGLNPLLWPEVSVAYGTPLVVNEDIIASLGETDPRDYLENGQWTWEKFREVLERYYVKEGSEVKYYALACQAAPFGNMFILSNGSRFAEKNEKGEYIPGFFSANAIKAMEEGLDIFHGTLGETIDKDSASVDAMINGTAVLGAVNSDHIIGLRGRISKEMSNFGILSWPTGPDVEPGYAFAEHANVERCISFPRAAKQPEAAATIINAIYEPFEGYETLDDILELMTRNYFFDARDSKVFYDMYLNSDYNYFHYSGMYGMFHQWLTSNKTPTEYIEANEDFMASRMEEYILPAMRGIEAVWGDID